ncbi:hypothetical protein FD967_01720 [Polynucleobacter sp. JS-Mosq-20-D10]|uniref:polysaccharide deacetylase WbmS family protein n=1 Tax=Polynucleobacter sp. JS-Mosq-20-D10 TaxID=2576922 RepID=UPI001BFE96A8|nr:hypothetical protein [Polynucleobacter sp. JS-Mosq-20-D10]QWE00788.1 hypothetical protein FD967_01720 [Polynucleobacter sp. JS-Mosq-20-D10]
MNTSTLSNLELINNNYHNTVFLTFDYDWACDDVLNFVFERLMEKKKKATFFVTHESLVTKEFIKYSDQFEFCIHPNFNFLLNGDFRYGRNISEVLDYYENILGFRPAGIRSHDSFFKTELLRNISARNYKYESNLLLSTELAIVPFSNWDKSILQIPIAWEDDEWCISIKKSTPKDLLAYKYLKVFNFHPIHIFLNSFDTSTYEKIKFNQRDTDFLKLHINNDYGVLNFFEEIISDL